MADAPLPTGWLHSPEEVEQVLATMPRPLFAEAAPEIEGSGENKTTLLYKAWKDVIGHYFPYPAQSIGCCVGRGFSEGVDLLECVEIAVGKEAEVFTPTSHEAVYGMARVDVGGQRGSYEDGAVGAWAARAVTLIGTVAQDVVGPYSDRLARLWGAAGVPDAVRQQAAQHRVKTSSLVRTYAELEDALANGYPVTVCSMQGFSLQRDAQGFCRPEGQWAHCLVPGTMVSTEVPKPIEDLQVGDLVYSHDGLLHPVTELFRRPYDGDLISIKCAGNPTVRFTSEHPLLVLRGEPDKGPLEWSWSPANRVRPGDHLLSPILRHPDGDGLPGWDRSGGSNQPHDITTYDRSLAWMFGYYIANGNRRLDHGVSFTVPVGKEDLCYLLADTFADLGLKARIEEHETFSRVIVDSVTVERSFRQWFGEGSATKHIPAFLFRGWDIEAVLRGIYDGDGGERPGGQVYFDTISPALARQVWQIQIELGRHVRMERTRPDRPGAYENAKPGHRVAYMKEPRKRPLTSFIPGYYAMLVRSVTRTAYVGQVYNCEVQDTHCYLADGVVSHNCMLLAGVRTDRPGALIVQSWGMNVPSGPLDLDQPPNSFWAARDVVESMLSMRDSWALSRFEGYPAKDLPSHWGWAGFA